MLLSRRKLNLRAHSQHKDQRLKWYTWQHNKYRKNGKELELETGVRFTLNYVYFLMRLWKNTRNS